MSPQLPNSVQILGANGKPLAETAHYAASKSVKEFRSWNPLLESADAELLPEQDTLSARSQDLIRNNGFAQSGEQATLDNVVGTGLRLSAKPDYRALGRDIMWAKEWARDVESKFRAWANTTECDAAGQLNLAGLTRLQFSTAWVQGEALALPLWLPDRDKRYATTLQLIDPARLSNPQGQLDSEQFRSGIEFDKFGRPKAYHIRTTHPGDTFLFNQTMGKWKRVPAKFRFGRKRVIHLYDVRRVGQSRGKPSLTSIMGDFKMLDHYGRTTLQSAIVNAMVAAFVETPLGPEGIARMFGGDSTKYIQERNEWEGTLQGGSIIPLFPGDKLNGFTPTQPGDAFEPFVSAFLHKVSAGLNLPYELLSKDFSKTNYSSARAALLEAWRFFMGRRQWISDYWMAEVYALWLEEVVNAGEVEAPDFYANKYAYLRAKWIGPGRGWVDPVKEGKASQIRLDGTISTLEDECAEQGKDWEEVIEQRAVELQFMKDVGITSGDTASASLIAPVDTEELPDGGDAEDTPDQAQEAVA